jgi:DNA adenine methylase
LNASLKVFHNLSVRSVTTQIAAREGRFLLADSLGQMAKRSSKMVPSGTRPTYEPILRWAGSKKRSLPEIQPFLPPTTERYFEVFAGSACLLFHLGFKKSVIADNNKELIKFYRTIAQKPSAVYRHFQSIPRNPRTYYSIRSRWNMEIDPVIRAAYFFYLNRNCFNGIYRTNSQGAFNVPFAADRVPAYPSECTVVAAASLLQRTRIFCSDFEKICSKVRKGDFVYLDPPYYVPAERVFREYSSKPFSNSDFQRLANTLAKLDRVGANFLLSYPDCSVASKLARRWNRSAITVRRTVASDTFSRRRTKELLVYNYDLPHA